MRQFYEFLADSNMYTNTNFVQPVRKICIESDKDIFIRLNYSNGGASARFRIYAKTPTYLDFQSANNGGGIANLSIKAHSESGTSTVFVSVEEYATGGNIDWYN